MNSFKYIGTRFFPSAILATTVALGSTATLAETESFFLARSVEYIDLHIAYSAKRWPIYRSIHREQQRDKADLASFEKMPDTDTEMKDKARTRHGSHRRAPYSKQPR